MKHLSHIRDPLSAPSSFYVLVETHGSNESHDSEVNCDLQPGICHLTIPFLQKLNNFLERSMNEGLVTDGTVAQDTSQFKSLWQIRESFAEAGSKYAHALFLTKPPK